MKKAIVILLLSINISFSLYAQQIKPTLNHIAVYVHSLKTSTDFYQNILHLDTIPEPFHDGRHTWFAIGGSAHLHLIQGAKEITAHEKNSHLCFSIADIKDMTAILEQHNIEYENWAGEKHAVTTRVDGVHQIYFKDPDGYWLEINDAKE
jgi:lactoylglutathione lyase